MPLRDLLLLILLSAVWGASYLFTRIAGPVLGPISLMAIRLFIAAGMLIKALGGNPRELRPVVFKGSALAITALLGNHLEYVVVGATNTTPHIASGRMRVVAVAAPKRLGGPLSNVPTWREQGVDMVSGTWRGIFGPKGLTAAQVAYWENALLKITKTAEWRSDVEKNYWTEDFRTGAELKKMLDEEYRDTKAILSDLGLVK